MKDVEILERAVARVFGGLGPFDTRALSSEADNRTWLLTHAGGSCIVKQPDRSGGLTVEPALEYELLVLAADAGIAPRPLGLDVETDLLFVEELTACATLADRQALESAFLSELARSLRSLHALAAPPSLRSFDPVAFAEHYCADIRGAQWREARALRNECVQLTARCAHLISGTSVCHNDLHAGNLLVGEQIWLIDFEYAVRAAPVVDVASFAAYNEIDTAAALSLARACLDDLSFSHDEFEALVRIHRVLGELWEIVRSDNNASP